MEVAAFNVYVYERGRISRRVVCLPGRTHINEARVVGIEEVIVMLLVSGAALYLVRRLLRPSRSQKRVVDVPAEHLIRRSRSRLK